jgi:amidase
MLQNHVVDASASIPDNSPHHSPALTVAQHDVFSIRTNDRFALAYEGQPPDPAMVGRLVGPVAIRGVEAGDLLAIEVMSIEPVTPYAYVLASSGYGLVKERLERRVQRVEVNERYVTLASGQQLPYRPMIGKLGLAPPRVAVPSTELGDYGGALSNTRAAPGSTIYLRAHNTEGLLSLEDVHAGMGDGEATSSAFEMAAQVTMRCSVANDVGLEPPVIVTEDYVLTLGQGDTLDQAVSAATDSMLELLQCRREIDLTEAAMLVGTAVDLRIAFVGGQPKKAYASVPRGLVRL